MYGILKWLNIQVPEFYVPTILVLNYEVMDNWGTKIEIWSLDYLEMY